jgi:hypothetical protein
VARRVERRRDDGVGAVAVRRSVDLDRVVRPAVERRLLTGDRSRGIQSMTLQVALIARDGQQTNIPSFGVLMRNATG